MLSAKARRLHPVVSRGHFCAKGSLRFSTNGSLTFCSSTDEFQNPIVWRCPGTATCTSPVSVPTLQGAAADPGHGAVPLGDGGDGGLQVGAGEVPEAPGVCWCVAFPGRAGCDVLGVTMWISAVNNSQCLGEELWGGFYPLGDNDD